MLREFFCSFRKEGSKYMIPNSSINKFGSKQAKEMGARISKVRKEKGMKQIELAVELGLSVDQMSNIENGRVVCKTEYIYLIEQILEVSALYLLHDFNEIAEKYEVMILLSKLSPEQIKKSKLILETAFL